MKGGKEGRGEEKRKKKHGVEGLKLVWAFVDRCILP